MEFFALEWFPVNPFSTIVISIFLNIVIAISGILPSAFITIGTVSILGLELGLIILTIGEAAGAIVSFLLYRKGINKLLTYPKIKERKNKLLLRLRETRGMEAFFMVISLRILPFVPSGAVTIAASMSKMGLLSFSIASTLGKIPALFIEAYTAFHILSFQTELQVALVIMVLCIFLVYVLWKKLFYQKRNEGPKQYPKL